MKMQTALLAMLVLGCAAFSAGMWFGGTRTSGTGSADLERAIHVEHAAKYTCSMHPFIIRDEPGLCPICSMPLVPVKDDAGNATTGAPGVTGSGISIDPVTMQNMGVRVTTVARRSLERTIRAVGRVTYQESRQYSVNSKIEGWVDRLYVNETGQTVKAGQPLMDIYSPALVAAQQEYLLALDNTVRLRDSVLPETRAGAGRLLEAARTRLRYWDISEAQIRKLEQTRAVRKSLTLFSPFGGIVTMKAVTQGMRVMGGEELMQISDISTVWIDADVYESELPWVRQGDDASVELPYSADQPRTGKISLIYPYVQNETRAIRARITMPNPGNALKPDMFVTVRIRSTPVADVPSIPEDAVLRSGTRQTVFVRRDQGRFEPREVRTGVTGEDGFVQIVAGLSEGEEVVTSAQFLMDSESKLREVVQKMLMAPAGTARGGGDSPASNEDLFK